MSATDLTTYFIQRRLAGKTPAEILQERMELTTSVLETLAARVQQAAGRDLEGRLLELDQDICQEISAQDPARDIQERTNYLAETAPWFKQKQKELTEKLTKREAELDLRKKQNLELKGLLRGLQQLMMKKRSYVSDQIYRQGTKMVSALAGEKIE